MNPLSLRPRRTVASTRQANRRGASLLPAALLRESARRLGWAGLMYSGLWSTFFLIALLFGIRPPAQDFATGLPAIALGLAVGGLSRSGRLAPGALLEIGLLFEVLGAIPISVSETWNKYGAASLTSLGQTSLGLLERLNLMNLRDLQMGTMPWVCIWILLFPALVPARPGKALAASLLAASTVPLALLLSFWVNGIAEPLRAQAGMLVLGQAFFPFLCAALATLGARVIYRMGVDMKRAQELGSYRLVRKLGQGGMGEVWEARHRLLARPAAVKLIRREVLEGSVWGSGSTTLFQRFEREAQATSSLVSPHAVALYDYGVTEEGTFYYVMELLDGLDLQTLVQRYGPQPPERVVHYLRQACHALSEAHEKGLIHRDVKPANLYACRMGRDADVLKVLDFGLVKSFHGPAERPATSLQPASVLGPAGAELTAVGIVTGTPAYLPPEMARGGESIGPAADLYSLGCVGYWLLTGHTVFEGDSMTQVRCHAQSYPTPPSKLTPEPIPDSLERVIMSCLEKSPKHRPQSADELAEALSACQLEGEWTQALARQWWSGHSAEPIRPKTSPEASSADATMSFS